MCLRRLNERDTRENSVQWILKLTSTSAKCHRPTAGNPPDLEGDIPSRDIPLHATAIAIVQPTPPGHVTGDDAVETINNNTGVTRERTLHQKNSHMTRADRRDRSGSTRNVAARNRVSTSARSASKKGSAKRSLLGSAERRIAAGRHLTRESHARPVHSASPNGGVLGSGARHKECLPRLQKTLEIKH
ncbi:hypothetical protein MRX96_046255 [Rhipicephalus microplus]